MSTKEIRNEIKSVLEGRGYKHIAIETRSIDIYSRTITVDKDNTKFIINVRLSSRFYLYKLVYSNFSSGLYEVSTQYSNFNKDTFDNVEKDFVKLIYDFIISKR